MTLVLLVNPTLWAPVFPSTYCTNRIIKELHHNAVYIRTLLYTTFYIPFLGISISYQTSMVWADSMNRECQHTQDTLEYLEYIAMSEKLL